MRLYHYFTLLVAIAISVCAAYYSIVGLTAIFAASVIPIIIMGSVLELAKITGAVWLKIYWREANWWIKFYLVPAVAVLMLITSMGIFGFLSKAHIEQTATVNEGLAQLEQIETEISRNAQIIDRAEEKIVKLENSSSNADTNIQEKISTEEARITTVYERLQQDIATANGALEAAIAPYVAQQEEADRVLALLSQYVANNNIRALQGLIGARQDGQYGTRTADAVQRFREKQEADRAGALEEITKRRTVNQEEISSLRSAADAQIAQSNDLINRLRSQIGTTSIADVEPEIQAQRDRIEQVEIDLEALYNKKYDIEIEARKLEAEVGPIKFVAELIYGADASNDLLEASVRWMILLLVAVFDPLAVVLTMAAITGITSANKARKLKKETVEVIKEVEVPVEIEKTVEVEKIVEVVKEVPVEKIVEVIKEVPIEVVKEVEVEKTVEVPVEVVKEIEKIIEDTEKVEELAKEVEDLLSTIALQKKKIKKLEDQQRVYNQPVAEPDLDFGDVSGASFGSTWPVNPVKGQMFLKVDTVPNKLYKWNSRKWIEVDIARVDDTLAYDIEYIRFLLSEIKHGRREYEDLSDIEQEQIKTYIRANGINEDNKR